jgi:hypothetical protein
MTVTSNTDTKILNRELCRYLRPLKLACTAPVVSAYRRRLPRLAAHCRCRASLCHDLCLPSRAQQDCRSVEYRVRELCFAVG